MCVVGSERKHKEVYSGSNTNENASHTKFLKYNSAFLHCKPRQKAIECMAVHHMNMIQ